eukprot:Tamp_09659.p1 GENE.Tamp_09659~~Tamp_09659.p1  ORF type:complete len:232 (+),score=44.88 Tamp_09659:406-1101(+)
MKASMDMMSKGINPRRQLDRLLAKANRLQAAKEAENKALEEKQALLDSKRAQKDKLTAPSFLQAMARHTHPLASSLPIRNASDEVAGGASAGVVQGSLAGLQVEENWEDDPGGLGGEMGDVRVARHEWGLGPTTFERSAAGKLGMKGGTVEGGTMLFKRNGGMTAQGGVDGGNSAGGLVEGGGRGGGLATADVQHEEAPTSSLRPGEDLAAGFAPRENGERVVGDVGLKTA